MRSGVPLPLPTKMTSETNYKNTAVKCIHCKSNDYTKQGYRKTQNRGKIQKYLCRDCNRYFTNDEGFYRMRNHPKKITAGIDMFYRGVSTRGVQDHFKAFYPHNSSHMSVYRWVLKFSRKISKFTGSLKLEVGEEVQIDEIEYKRRLHHEKGKKGVEDVYFIDSICPKTKFMTAKNFSNQREIKDLAVVTKTIKKRTGKQVKMITTDGLQGYPKAIKKAWGYNLKECRYNVYHNQVITSKEDTFNYPIERLHNNVRARTKIFRGFHGCIESSETIMKGYEIFYNFIRKHQTINCCPYELAIPELKDKLNVNNKWLALIELASKN